MPVIQGAGRPKREPGTRRDRIIVGDKTNEEEKVCSNLDQIFQAEFNNLLFILIALKLNWIFIDFLHNRLIRSDC
jgi:hypothetical protein